MQRRRPGPKLDELAIQVAVSILVDPVVVDMISVEPSCRVDFAAGTCEVEGLAFYLRQSAESPLIRGALEMNGLNTLIDLACEQTQPLLKELQDLHKPVQPQSVALVEGGRQEAVSFLGGLISFAAEASRWKFAEAQWAQHLTTACRKFPRLRTELEPHVLVFTLNTIEAQVASNPAATLAEFRQDLLSVEGALGKKLSDRDLDIAALKNIQTTIKENPARLADLLGGELNPDADLLLRVAWQVPSVMKSIESACRDTPAFGAMITSTIAERRERHDAMPVTAAHVETLLGQAEHNPDAAQIEAFAEFLKTQASEVAPFFDTVELATRLWVVAIEFESVCDVLATTPQYGALFTTLADAGDRQSTLSHDFGRGGL